MGKRGPKPNPNRLGSRWREWPDEIIFRHSYLRMFHCFKPFSLLELAIFLDVSAYSLRNYLSKTRPMTDAAWGKIYPKISKSVEERYHTAQNRKGQRKINCCMSRAKYRVDGGRPWQSRPGIMDALKKASTNGD